MAKVSTIETYLYTGKAYNILVSSYETKPKKKSFFDGYVVPNYKVVHHDGYPIDVKDVKNGDILIDRDNSFWKVESLLEYTVENEVFCKITLNDGRILDGNKQCKLLVTSPKNIQFSDLSSGDTIADVELSNLQKKLRNIKQENDA
jgi:hypothetical protein